MSIVDITYVEFITKLRRLDTMSAYDRLMKLMAKVRAETIAELSDENKRLREALRFAREACQANLVYGMRKDEDILGEAIDRIDEVLAFLSKPSR